MLSDPLADLLTRIRNAQAVKKKTLSAPYSRLKENLVKIMINEKYLKDYQVTGKKPKQTLEITLKYSHKKPAISNLIRVSKPGRRIYADLGNLAQLTRGRGIAILSTSKGIITVAEARKKKIGGEVICKIN